MNDLRTPENQNISNRLTPPPFSTNLAENKGGVNRVGFLASSDFLPKMTLFLKRFPLSSTQNTPKFSACGGPKIWLPQNLIWADLVKIRGGVDRFDMSWYWYSMTFDLFQSRNFTTNDNQAECWLCNYSSELSGSLSRWQSVPTARRRRLAQPVFILASEFGGGNLAPKSAGFPPKWQKIDFNTIKLGGAFGFARITDPNE
mgnify:CR=1 FL=1